ncbi:WRKY transcription factor 55 [Tripterygium wilfordii]|uniref:WRKY transcription factor 55 n=1 Tax=Tripterygium wilfordii TaxID=458696 RepID=A0A7J7E1T7_TRIWF|nr:WRKY transcription factor 55 [Tripterygium wilfordii]KAF5752632.1 WRKY transcription factor 55 [Tripterygium wilfordii]
MEEAISLFFQGCKLAQELEGNLQHYLSHNQGFPPGPMLSEYCNEIIKIFVSAKERLSSCATTTSSSYSPPGLFPIGRDASLHDWLRSAMAAGSGPSTSVQVPVSATQLDVSYSGRFLVGSSSSSSPSSQQRPRRSMCSKDDMEKKTVRVAAPLIGNTDVPPDDGYTWRKYGQKEILGSRYPRSYYRCTHQKMYQCPAKKQVQRLDHDPYTFQVMYRADHTCHMSSTAPSIAPPTHITTTSSGARQQLPGTPPWLEFNLGSGGGGGGSRSSSIVNTMVSGDVAAAGAGHGADPSSYLVAEMADAMFNSGSGSTTNSMEFLFQSPRDKWEPEEGTRRPQEY